VKPPYFTDEVAYTVMQLLKITDTGQHTIPDQYMLHEVV